jgi:NAD-dependent deacetylase sirtuin 2
LEKYNLPHPQAVFEIDFFRSNPDPFYMLSKELLPGTYKPTKTHYFLKLLHDKGLLQRCYTQNIDSLEHLAGLPTEAVIAAHGNFDTAYCIDCRSEHDTDYVREAIMQQTPCRCVKQDGCQGLVKPGIVFFGESLPERFWNSIPSDFAQADLLIVMGSSLVVHPFASLIDRVDQACPRLLINREKVGEAHPELWKMGYRKGFDFSDDARSRDVALLGDCDAMIEKLCDQLGWLDDLNSLVRLG